MKRNSRLLPLLLIPLIIVSCGFTKGASPQSTQGSGGATGAFPDPAKGLDSMPAYRATLKISFDGTQAGKASQWSQAYSLTTVQATQTRIMEYSKTGLDATSPAYPAMEGYSSGVYYFKDKADSACAAAFAEAGEDPNRLVEPASLLPKLKTITSAGKAEQVNGIQTDVYTFDASAVTTIKGAQVQGKVWLAESGNYIASLTFLLKGGKDVFDQDTEGTMTWQYDVSPLDPASEQVLPGECPLPLPDVPVTDDATSLLKFPGYLSYQSNQDIQSLVKFYMDGLPAAGFTQVGTATSGTAGTSLAFSKGKQSIGISIKSGTPNGVIITSQAPPVQSPTTPAASPTPNPAGSTVDNPGARVSNSASLLLGSGSKPSVLDSYHFEYSFDDPTWNGTAIVQEKTSLSADVQGKNVHFNLTAKGSTSEVYLVDGKAYTVAGGKIASDVGMAKLSWTTWPVDLVTILGVGALETSPAGTETVEGRTAEVYNLNGKIGDDPTGMFAGLTSVTSVSGKVWVDQETGALLKASLDFTADVKSDNATKGSGSGHVDIVVSKMNGVTVSLP